MNKKEYQAPLTKFICPSSEFSFMAGVTQDDWAETKKGQFIEDEELDNSESNVWNY